MRTTLCLALAAFAAAPALAQDTTPPPGFQIESVAFHGSGCRPGSVVTNVAPDARAMTLVFDSFVVEATPTARQATKVCELDLKLKVPSGYSVALATVDARGFASLADAQSHGKVRTLYAFGRSQQPLLLADEKFVGPHAADYHLRGETDLAALEFSACGGKRLMRIRTRIDARLAPRSTTGAALVTVDSLDKAVTQKYALVWKACVRDDRPDDRPPPDFNQSFTARCQAKQLNRQSQVVGIFEGAGVAMTRPMAKKAASHDAMKRCRADRRQEAQRSQVTCVADEQTCEFTET